MPSKPVKILLTGLPGCGKTTAVIKIVTALESAKVAGFYTQEVRENNVRRGFGWTRLDGASGILAHVDIKGLPKVGKYGVDVAGFERYVVPALDIDLSDAELFVIDEIGKMECLSEEFIHAVKRLLDSDRSVLATVAQKGGGLIREIKDHPGVILFNLTRENRDKTITKISQLLSSFNRPL